MMRPVRGAAGQRDPLNSSVVDDEGCLIVRDQQISVQTGRRTRLGPQLLEGDRALGDIWGVLHHQDVARHQVRTGDTRQLVVRKVPWLDTEDHADRAALHVRLPDGRMKFYRCKEALGVLGIVGENASAELHLSASFVNLLAHFECHQAGEFIDLCVH